MKSLRSSVVIVLLLLLCMPVFALQPQRIEQLKGDSQSIIENIIKQKNTQRRALQVENTTPDAQASAYTWGTLANEARSLIESQPIQIIWPVASICITMLSLNFIGDCVSDAFDPKKK